MKRICLDAAAVSSGVLIIMTGFLVSFLGLLLTDVKVLLLLLHSKKREVAELLCLTFPLWDITCSPQTQDINWTFMDVQFTSCVYGIEYDGKGYSLVKTIELLRRSALRLLQSSMLCRIVFIRLLIKIFHGI